MTGSAGCCVASNIEALQSELRVTDEILASYKLVLDAVPECAVHGPCVPHAVEWVQNAVSIIEALRSALSKYGHHTDKWCHLVLGVSDRCTCGLDEALKIGQDGRRGV
jgi:hypothetical protein